MNRKVDRQTEEERLVRQIDRQTGKYKGTHGDRRRGQLDRKRQV